MTQRQVLTFVSLLQFFSAAYTHFQSFASFFLNFTHKFKNCTHKMQNASHLLQNEALHSKYHNNLQTPLP